MQLKLTCTGCGRNVEISGEFSEGVASVPCPACKTPLEIPPNILDVGDVIGGFKIEKHLGSGAMGSVYLARQLSMDRQIAIKVMSKDGDISERAAADFLKEIRLLGKLDHPNIVGAYEAGEDKGLYFVAMRYLQGETLEQRIEREGPIDEKPALQIMLKLADALDCAWERHGIMHRDLKPDNVMLVDGDEPILLDLGISKVQGTKTQHTISGQILGTPLYMSPEQARDSANVDLRTDIYSMGCTLFHVLTGHVPFDSTDVVGVLMKHSLDPVPVNDLLKAKVSEPCIELVQRMMAKNPDDRFESWRKATAQMKRVLRGEGARKKPAQRRYHPRVRNVTLDRQQRKSGSVIGLFALAGLLLLGCAALVCSFVGDAESPAPPPDSALQPPVVIQEFTADPTPTHQLPPGWEPARIGPMKGGATASYGDRKLTIEGGGKDMWGRSDDFAFVHKRVPGNFTFTARVDSFTADHANAMAGITIREDSSPSSRYVAIFTQPNGHIDCKRRRRDNTETSHKQLPKPMKAPTWLRLYRRSSNVYCYASTDNKTWHSAGVVPIEFGRAAQIGFFVCSHDDGKSGKAVFSNLRLVADSDRLFIYKFVLVEANTAKFLAHLRDGEVIHFRNTGRRLNIRGDVTGRGVQSVQFFCDGRLAQLQNAYPYYLGSDNRGVPLNWTPTKGPHTLTAVPWTGKKATGQQGESLKISFTVTD